MMTPADALGRGDAILKEALRDELRRQGHHLTGALEQSIHSHVITGGNVTVVQGTMLYYGAILNFGVTAFKVPYSEGSGAGHSRYISGLINFFQLKGLSEKEATRAAFATARKQKKEGMPTAESARFSSTGRRIGFLGDANDQVTVRIDQAVTAGFDAMVEEAYHTTKTETI